ncbi:gas vesicle protein K, partial [Streptomyces sp. NPDC005070]
RSGSRPLPRRCPGRPADQQVMERQALRRVDQGDLSEEDEERLGTTLMVLHDRMRDLCATHGLTLEDLNLDLGPLGPLLPPPD